MTAMEHASHLRCVPGCGHSCIADQDMRHLHSADMITHAKTFNAEKIELKTFLQGSRHFCV